MRIILDTAILVRGHGSSKGLARDLLISIVESDHILLLSNEMLYELAKVLRYPRMLALHGLSEERIYDYVSFLREAAEIVVPKSLVGHTDSRCKRHCRHANCGHCEADILPPAEGFLRKAGITVLDDISLMRQLRS